MSLSGTRTEFIILVVFILEIMIMIETHKNLPRHEIPPPPRPQPGSLLYERVTILLRAMTRQKVYFSPNVCSLEQLNK